MMEQLDLINQLCLAIMEANPSTVSSGEAGESEGECVCGGEVAMRGGRDSQLHQR